MSTTPDSSDETSTFCGYDFQDEEKEEKDRPIDHILYFLSDHQHLTVSVIGLGLCSFLYYGVPAAVHYLNHCDWFNYTYPTG